MLLPRFERMAEIFFAEMPADSRTDLRCFWNQVQLAGFPAWSKHKGSRGDLAWEILRRRYYIFGLLLQPKVRRTEKYNFPAHCIPNKCHESGWIGINLNAEVECRRTVIFIQIRFSLI